MDLPLTNIEKFRNVDSSTHAQLDISKKNLECFLCFGNKHDVENQCVDHRYRRSEGFEGIQINWANNIFNINWKDNYVIVHE